MNIFLANFDLRKGLNVMNDRTKPQTAPDLDKETGSIALDEIEICYEEFKGCQFRNASTRYDGYFHGEVTASDL